MRRVSVLLVALSLGLGGLAAETPKNSGPLFNGKDFSGWESVAVPATDISSVCHYNADGSLAVVGKPVSFIATTASYENYRLHVEWRWPADARNSNGGILVHIASGPKDRAWPLSLQIQTKIKAAGDLLPMAGATFAEKLTSAPGAATPILAHSAADSEKPVGEWNACDIVCRGDTVEVTVNGVLQNKITHAQPASGRIGFQLEGMPYELRNVYLEPLTAIGSNYQNLPPPVRN
jgi:hypothetical protein